MRARASVCACMRAILWGVQVVVVMVVVVVGLGGSLHCVSPSCVHDDGEIAPLFCCAPE